MTDQSNAVWFCTLRILGIEWASTFINPELDMTASGARSINLPSFFKIAIFLGAKYLEMTTPTVLLKRLGRVSYCRALTLQKALASRYKEEQPQGEVRGGHRAATGYRRESRPLCVAASQTTRRWQSGAMQHVNII